MNKINIKNQKKLDKILNLVGAPIDRQVHCSLVNRNILIYITSPDGMCQICKTFRSGSRQWKVLRVKKDQAEIIALGLDPNEDTVICQTCHRQRNKK